MGAAELVRETIGFLKNRRRAYLLTFGSTKLFARWRGVTAAYRAAFHGYAGQEVLMDLARFCRAAETCYHDDARKHAVAEGRREVFLRIQNHLRLTEPQLFQLYSGQNFNVTETTNE